MSPPKSYSDFYGNSLNQYKRPPTSARAYTLEKHFYHRPTLSPYLNPGRRPSTVGPVNSYQYVLPEIERRSQPQKPSQLKGTNSYYNRIYQ